MPRNGLPPHCSWEIDRHGNRRIRFRWRKGIHLHHRHAGGDKTTGAATTKRPSGATLGARSEKRGGSKTGSKNSASVCSAGARSANHEGWPKGSPPPRHADERKR